MADEVGGVELAEDAAPFVGGPVGADAEGFQLFMGVAQHRVGGLPREDIDEVVGKEAPGGPQDRGHHLLGLQLPVEIAQAPVADIAIVTGAGGLAEGLQQGLAAAQGRLRIGDEGFQLAQLHPAAHGGHVRVEDLLAAERHVVLAPEGQGVRRQAVAARAADLLIIGLDALGQVRMADIAHVRLVDAHAEGDGRHHDDPVRLQELGLVRVAQGGLEPRVIGNGAMAEGREACGEGFRALARVAIDDAAFAPMGGDEIGDLAGRAGLALHGEAQVGSVEGAHEDAGRGVEEFADDLVAGGRVGGGGDGHGLDIPQHLPDFPQAQIFRAEIVAPLRDAMGLVDGQQIGAAIAEQLHEAGQGEALGRHIDEPQAPLRDGALGGEVFAGRIAGVQGARRDAVGAQLLHLVMHEGDEGGDHHGQPLPHHGRQLVAQGLAAAGGHHRQHILARENGAQHLLLPGPEGGIAIDAGQRGAGLVKAGVDLGGGGGR